MQFCRHKAKQFHFIYFSLFAVLMLTFGPFTSQLLAAMATQPQIVQQQNKHTSHNKHHSVTSQSTAAKSITKMPAHHNMNLCGYCDLLHSPVISAEIPLIIQSIHVHQEIIYYHSRLFFISPYNYPLSQAPPFPS